MWPDKKSIPFYILLLLFFGALACLGLFVERHQNYAMMSAYGLACISYLFFLQQPDRSRALFVLGLLSRLALFFSLPHLSDDVYRFIWDGTLLKNGIHPFEHLPGFYLDKSIPGITQGLYDRLNSPNYFTIYPPINQGIFWLSVVVGNGSWITSANVMRVCLLLADIGTFWLLKRLLAHYQKPVSLAFWYYLNPLVILEFVGNLHFEGLVIFFVLAGVYCYELNRKWWSAAGLGLAIGTKLLPFIYLPYFFFKGLKESKWSVAILAGLVGLITLTPLLNTSFIAGIQSSLDLYFRTFEFNASIYYLAREIGFLMYGYNNIAKIGPLLSIISIISIISISIVGMKRQWLIPKVLLFILTIYLSLTTTVHPWYILPLVAFGVLSGHFYPIIWSFFIFITYLGYSKSGYELPLFWVAIEYLILLIAMAMDYFNLKNRPIGIYGGY